MPFPLAIIAHAYGGIDVRAMIRSKSSAKPRFSGDRLTFAPDPLLARAHPAGLALPVAVRDSRCTGFAGA
jgi:hypothetical protein